ncbi:hypothetical protein F0169_26995, partial [Pseudomonas sp. MAFF 212408]|nr:hypothetical protein [Pseudomonas kitaguniensis]
MLLASRLSSVQAGLRFATSDKVGFMDDHDKVSVVAKPVALLTASTRCPMPGRHGVGQEPQSPNILTSPSGTARMKKLIALIVLALVAVLYVGYYQALEDADVETILFIKKHPTFQMKFY